MYYFLYIYLLNTSGTKITIYIKKIEKNDKINRFKKSRHLYDNRL